MLPAARLPAALASELLHPRAFYVAGLGLTVVLFLIVHADSQGAAERRLALHGEGPDMVAIAAFDAARHVGDAGEVLIEAQVDVTLPLEIHYRAGGALRRALAFPVLAVDARRNGGTARSPVLGFFHVDLPILPHGVIDPARWLPAYERVGAFGPIVALNGELGAPDPVTAGVGAALSEQGRAVTDTLLGVALYPEGRAAALSRAPVSPWRAVVMGLAALLLAAGFVLSLLRPLLVERRRLTDVVRSGRRRGGAAPVPETPKGRHRLAPLASPARMPGSAPMAARLADALRGWRIRSWR